MKGMQNFVLGFSLSLLSMAVIGQLFPSASHTTNNQDISDIKIELFKSVHAGELDNTPSINLAIKKQSLTINNDVPTENEITLSELATTSPSNSKEDISDDELLYSFNDVEGFEDDEVIAINIDNEIPIEYNNSNIKTRNVEILHNTDTAQVALLPPDIADTNNIDNNDDPWIVAKGSKHIDNKKILEKYTKDITNDFVAKNDIESFDKGVSYQVAEKIKQSIIFPIPEEILNDENLIPTFINSKPKKKNAPKPVVKKESPDFSLAEDLQILPKKDVVEEKTDENILSKVTSWFKDNTTQEKETKKRITKKVPSYSSQENISHTSTDSEAPFTVKSDTDDLVSFYETLQETKAEQSRRGIVPTELKLSFQPNKAEISGQTLHWLKVFSDKAKEDNTYLQVRLDANASIELQRKRLNLLYTIFINNGVTPEKVDTVFSLTEQNAFIIRTLKIK